MQILRKPNHYLHFTGNDITDMNILEDSYYNPRMYIKQVNFWLEIGVAFSISKKKFLKPAIFLSVTLVFFGQLFRVFCFSTSSTFFCQNFHLTASHHGAQTWKTYVFTLSFTLCSIPSKYCTVVGGNIIIKTSFSIYREVVSSNTSRFEAHEGFFRNFWSICTVTFWQKVDFLISNLG